MSIKGNGLPVYPIGSVIRQTGLTGRQIRYYEQMELIDPVRSKGNQRLYSDTDVERLVRIKRLLDEGYTIEGIKALLLKGASPNGEPVSEEPLAASRPIPGLDLLAESEDSPGDRGTESELLEIPSRFAGSNLTSLYPVNNRARLLDILMTRKKTDKTD